MGPLVFLSLLLLSVRCKIYFHEKFDEGFLERWTESESTSVAKHGKLVVEKSEFEDGEFFAKTSEDASHYQYGTWFTHPLDTSKNDLVFQYIVHHPQKLDCGGAYIKLVGKNVDFKSFDGNSPYFIMFGPDFCGYSTKKIHFIVNHGGKNHEIDPEIPAVLDRVPHLYTLILQRNQTFKVFVDDQLKRNGTLSDDFKILLPKTIPDPEDKKPEDWVDDEFIPDPEDKKPEDWVDVKTIVDPNATKPSDWDDESDGEWTPDSIPNPDYKGEWEPKTIKNPRFKGPWTARKIANPDFRDDLTIGKSKIHGVGIEIWQVKSGTLFGELIVSDDVDEAQANSKLIVERLKKIGKVIEEKEIAEREKIAEEKKEKVSESSPKEDEDVDDDGEEKTTTEEEKEPEHDHRVEL